MLCGGYEVTPSDSIEGGRLMRTHGRRWLLLGVTTTLVLVAAAAAAQHAAKTDAAASNRIMLDVVVSGKSGAPVGDLAQSDFTILDNKAARPITSFKVVTGREAAMQMIVVIDAVNNGYDNVSVARIQIEKFFQSEQGHLAYPMALVLFTDSGPRVVQNFTEDGNVLSKALDQAVVDLRSITRSAGYYGAVERAQLSWRTMHQIDASAATGPGRKIVIWISPGWPLLSGPNTELDNKQEGELYEEIVSFSTELRQDRVTLYMVDPRGAGESLGVTTYYEEFLKGVTKPGQAQIGNIGLQVLSVQSGGRVLNQSNDVAGLLQQCVADNVPYYEISFDAAPAEKRAEYHRIEVQIAKPGLEARTRQGYYTGAPAN